MLDVILLFHLQINSHFKQNYIPLKLLLCRHIPKSLKRSVFASESCDVFNVFSQLSTCRTPNSFHFCVFFFLHFDIGHLSLISTQSQIIGSLPQMTLPISYGTCGNIYRPFGLSHLGEEGATGIQWVKAGDAMKHPTMNGTITHNNELSSLKCQ